MPEDRLPKLMNAVYWAYNQALNGGPWSPIHNPSDGSIKTFCNFAVNYVCKSVGYIRFGNGDPVLANEMIRQMKDPNGDWIILGSAEVAQSKANAGSLIVAGAAFDGGHGHVAVLIPGLTEFSSSWQQNAPTLMNIGQDVFIGKKASWAFRAGNIPQYFGLKMTLD